MTSLSGFLEKFVREQFEWREGDKKMTVFDHLGANGLCKSYYLAYDDVQGFFYKTLNVFQRMIRYFLGAYSCTHLKTIKNKIFEDIQKNPTGNFRNIEKLSALVRRIDTCWNSYYANTSTLTKDVEKIFRKTFSAPKALPNKGNSCFLASAWQIVQNTPSLLEELRNPVISREDKEIWKYIMQFRDLEGISTEEIQTSLLQAKILPNENLEKIKNLHKAALLRQFIMIKRSDMDKLRQILHKFHPDAVSSLPEEGDAVEILEKLLEKKHSLKRFHISLTKTSEEMEKEFPLDNETENKMFQIDRTDDTGKKNLTRFQISKKSFYGRKYQLSSYIIHCYNHYIAYVKKEDGSYWRCSDAQIKLISEKQFLENSGKASLIHLAKSK